MREMGTRREAVEADEGTADPGKSVCEMEGDIEIRIGEGLSEGRRKLVAKVASKTGCAGESGQCDEDGAAGAAHKVAVGEVGVPFTWRGSVERRRGRIRNGVG